ncbi:UvrD-helicase domain-containing protein, partial [Bacillus thuringiensis]|uniref:UvrD-helicase domain-containing protein n=1 Tax=Bacillus thuringiensis TaxID=1428 RepID=UPI00164342B9
EGFEYIEVDELEDRWYGEYEIVKLLGWGRNNLFMGGDEDEGIYGWGGGSEEIILSLRKEFDKSRIIGVNRNYGWNGFIVGVGNEVMKLNEEGFDKEVYSVR